MTDRLRRLLIDRAATLSMTWDWPGAPRDLFNANHYHWVASEEIANDWPTIIWC